MYVLYILVIGLNNFYLITEFKITRGCAQFGDRTVKESDYVLWVVSDRALLSTSRRRDDMLEEVG